VPRARAQYILDKPPEEARGLEITTRLGDSIPLNLTFTRSNGKPVKLEELFHHNRPVIMAMVYFRCPLLCPKVQEDIIKSLNGLDFTVGKEFDLVIVSFDPRDGPVESERARTDALRMYGHNTTESVLAGWTYLTGTPENSRALGDGLGFPFRFLPKSGEFSHGTAIYILTPEGVISRCIPRLDYDVRDLRFSLIDASGGKIGTLSDRFTLFCYHPAANGKYIISPMRVMQVGAAISAVLVFSVLGFLFAGEAIKRRQRRLASLIGAQTEPESFHVTGPGADSPKAPHPFHKMAGHTS
jgi:protein SCO1/2